MTIHGSSRGRGHVWLILLAVLGAALVSLLALPQWDSAARADEREGRGQQIMLERSADPAFQRELTEASNGGVYEPHIIGGTSVPNGKHTFMAYLDLRFNDGSSPTCAGTLIDPDSVLTAAHCVKQPGTTLRGVQVYVGGSDTTANTGWFKRFATSAESHPRYTPNGNLSYDVAVLKLNRAVTGNSSEPIKLNTRTQAGAALETPGNMLTAAGWGHTSAGGTSADRMKEVSLRVVSDATAQQAWSNSSTPYVPSLMVATDSQAGKDVAPGDSGGPLFDPGATPTQVGIVSGGASGTGPGSKPTAYTDINNLEILTFIEKTAKQ